ncbi:MAG: DUF2793 domain-containing protein, partial [Planctomycetota bacterium]
DADGTWTVPPDIGEANTASNIGTSGIGVFKQKNVLDLEFKQLHGIEGVATVDDVGNDELDIKLNFSGLTEDDNPNTTVDYIAFYDVSEGVHNRILIDDFNGEWRHQTIDKDLTAPPGSPAGRDQYIVGSPATGAWTGQENSIATYIATETAWSFRAPDEGFATYVLDEDLVYFFNGTSWVASIATLTSIGASELDNNSVTNAILRDSAALSVIGRSANSVGDPADIVAGTDAHVLRRSGTSLGFGQLATGAYSDDSVTFAKVQDIATARILGRVTAATGAIEELTGTQATTLLDDFVGDSGAGGTKGLVPAPAAGDAAADKFLKADGTWTTPTDALGLQNVVEDLTPQLGGDLDLNTNDITGTGNISTTGHWEVIHTSTEDDDEAIRIVHDAAGFGGTKAVAIDYDAATVAATEDEEAILINFDDAEVDGMEAGVNINPLLQQSGTFGNTDSIDNNGADVTTALSSGGAGNISIFVADNDTFTIGDAAKFTEIEIVLDTPASNPGVAPTFEYSTGVGTWAAFSPVDGTDQFRFTGTISWLLSDIPGWVAGAGSEFLIRITRTRNTLGTTPIVDLVQVVEGTLYLWDKDARVVANKLELGTGEGGASNRRLAVVGGLIQSTDTSDIEGRYISHTSLEVLETANYADESVTLAKLQHIATDSFLGRDTAATGDVEVLTGTQATSLLDNFVGDSGAGGTKGLVPAPAPGDAAAGKYLDADGTWTTPPDTDTDTHADAKEGGTGVVTDVGAFDFNGTRFDVTDSSGDAVIDIAVEAIDDTRLRHSAGLSVIGRSANTTGDPADITAGTDAHVLRRSGTTLGFGQLVTASYSDDSVTFAKTQNIATARILGRTTAATGNIEELTGTAATALLDVFVGDSGAGGTKGLVPAPVAGDAAAGKYLDADGTWTVPPAASDTRINISEDGVQIVAAADDLDFKTYFSVTNPAGSNADVTLADDSIGFDKIVDIATDSFLGRDTAATG